MILTVRGNHKAIGGKMAGDNRVAGEQRSTVVVAILAVGVLALIGYFLVGRDSSAPIQPQVTSVQPQLTPQATAPEAQASTSDQKANAPEQPFTAPTLRVPSTPTIVSRALEELADTHQSPETRLFVLLGLAGLTWFVQRAVRFYIFRGPTARRGQSPWQIDWGYDPSLFDRFMVLLKLGLLILAFAIFWSWVLNGVAHRSPEPVAQDLQPAPTVTPQREGPPLGMADRVRQTIHNYYRQGMAAERRGDCETGRKYYGQMEDEIASFNKTYASNTALDDAKAADVVLSAQQKAEIRHNMRLRKLMKNDMDVLGEAVAACQNGPQVENSDEGPAN